MDELVHWLLEGRSMVGPASPAEAFWLLVNTMGVFVSLLAAVLSVADQWRVRSGEIELLSSTRVGAARERAGILVLAKVAARTEIIKASIHAGNAFVGFLVASAPEPVRPAISLVFVAVTIWFLVVSILILWSTIITLRGRYDYRSVRGRGRRASWYEMARAMDREARSDLLNGVRFLWRRVRGVTG